MTVTGTLARKDRATYIAQPNKKDFYRMAKGFESSDEALNPQTKTTNYIDGTASTVLTSYAEEWGVSGERYVGDKINDMFAAMADMRVIGVEAQLEMLTVNLTEEDSATAGSYLAYRQKCAYSPESGGGGAATDSLTISGKINANGAPEYGLFTPADSIDDPGTPDFSKGTFTVKKSAWADVFARAGKAV